jgi:novobiocin biosynthesis protein NovU/D-mycarose 3-C-methyltransferase
MRCAACRSTGLQNILDLGSTPLANTYRDRKEAPEKRYPLTVGVCPRAACGLVQSLAIVPDELIYGDDYGFYSGGSGAQLAYHQAGAELLLTRYPELARKLTIEVACNDGSLLQHFQEAECNTLGIDPASGPVKVARERGLQVIQEPLTSRLANEVRALMGPAGLVIAYNSMAHVGDLTGVLVAVTHLMDENSVAVFEVQYLPDLIAGNMYDQVYHEHRYFWSLTSLQKVCEMHGLHLLDAELIELQGGGLRVSLTTDPWKKTLTNQARDILASERWLPFGYASFQGQVDRTRDHLADLVDLEIAAGRQVAGYGASAKATTIVNYCDIGGALEYIVDTTPYKQGRYLPGTNVQIISPEDAAQRPVDTMVLLTANYLGHVLRRGDFAGRWITPQPLPAVL